MVARGVGGMALFFAMSQGKGDAGDHKGPPHATSSTLAPTGDDGLFLRLMPITAALSAPLSP
jgi:hypothetical protein